MAIKMCFIALWQLEDTANAAKQKLQYFLFHSFLIVEQATGAGTLSGPTPIAEQKIVVIVTIN